MSSHVEVKRCAVQTGKNRHGEDEYAMLICGEDDNVFRIGPDSKRLGRKGDTWLPRWYVVGRGLTSEWVMAKACELAQGCALGRLKVKGERITPRDYLLLWENALAAPEQFNPPDNWRALLVSAWVPPVPETERLRTQVTALMNVVDALCENDHMGDAVAEARALQDEINRGIVRDIRAGGAKC